MSLELRPKSPAGRKKLPADEKTKTLALQVKQGIITTVGGDEEAKKICHDALNSYYEAMQTQE